MSKKLSQKSLSLYLRILSYLRPYTLQIVVVIFCSFGFVITSTLSVWMIAPVVSTMFEKASPQQTQTSSQMVPAQENNQGVFNLNDWMKEHILSIIPRGNPLTTLKWLCLFIILTFLLKNLFAFTEFYTMTFVEQKVVKDLREQIYEKIIDQSMMFFQKHKTGDLISNITNDINSVNVAVNRGFTKIIRDPVMIIIFLIILFSISWKLTLIAVTILPLTGILIRKIGGSLRRRSNRVQERIADITSVLQETISGIKVVKAFSMENFENKKFRNYSTSHFRAVVKQIRMLRLSSPLSETLGVGIMAGVIYYGGMLVYQGNSLSPEDFMRFLIILFAIIEPLKSLGELNNNAQIALASGSRIFKIIDEPIEVIEKKDAIVKKKFEHSVAYQDVCFRYKSKGELVLKNVNFEVRKYQKVAFVGSSGAGKTTIINLLPRFYDVTSGSIRIDGTDVRDLTLSSLRSLLGIVTQEVILFNDTVTRNIAYGIEEYSLEDIEHAAKMANAYDFIKEMPEGFDTIIGERGMLLSGGQRQRISIARAILKNPPILIFDEATSSLDSESEALIQEAIENLMKERTVFIIAHRLSTIVRSDLIIVLHEGRIIDRGTNSELLKSSERYRQLYDLQFKLEEVE
jgi:subfamily B ATP-binding cassette protein MsbA